MVEPVNTYVVVDGDAAETVQKEQQWWLDVAEPRRQHPWCCKLLHLQLQRQTDCCGPPSATASQWHLQPPTSAPQFSIPSLDWHGIIQPNWGMVWFLGVGYSTQPVTCDWPYNPPNWFQPSLSDRTGQGLWTTDLHKWGLACCNKCGCGMDQTMSHTADECPVS